MSVLSFKPFYVHGCRNRRRDDSHALRSQPHGFSVRVSPAGEDRLVNIQVALCHYSDEFSRKTGREIADATFTEQINARDLPQVLVKLKAKLHKDNPKHWHGFYDYVLRYVV